MERWMDGWMQIDPNISVVINLFIKNKTSTTLIINKRGEVKNEQ